MVYPEGRTGPYVIPGGVTSIAKSGFDSCFDLTAVTIPNSVTNIGQLAFAGCLNLTTAVLPKGLLHIGAEAFAACHALSEVRIPRSVLSIGSHAYSACSSLGSVRFLGDAPSLASFIFSNYYREIEIRVSVGASGFEAGVQHQAVHPELIIERATKESDGTMVIETDALDTAGLRILHSENLSGVFREVDDLFRPGGGRLVIPDKNQAVQGSNSFFRVVHQ